jgi:hypothetical protein
MAAMEEVLKAAGETKYGALASNLPDCRTEDEYK